MGSMGPLLHRVPAIQLRTALAVAVGIALLAFELTLAVPVAVRRLKHSLTTGGILALAMVPVGALLAYRIGIGGSWQTTLGGVGYATVPVLLLSRWVRGAPGPWADWVAAILIWLPMQFQWLYDLFPDPPSLTPSLAVLLAVSVGAAAFVLVRQLEGTGYAIAWRPGFGRIVLAHFGVFAALAVPLGLRMHFLAFGPTRASLELYPLAIIGFLLFVAWPEEFLFRGLAQNLLARLARNPWVGLALASAVFGLSHVTQPPVPNWPYVFLATIAGLFYGSVWLRTGSLLPAAILHALVDATWFAFFPHT
jgi:uncharacterized protein